ncbi:protein-L-isoaspartate O-methyltransferase [Rhizobium sp. CRIBSB]|nr:protein-L-isoaspartate O-methyltransferase [Rhizobium sp. CRIBSB]
MEFAAARKVMVDSQVRVNDVTDRGLQAALLAVPRERFCAPGRAFVAYAEVEPEIAGDRRLMLAREVSKLLMAAEPQAGETALAIAGPYAAAVLAQLGLTVTAQESDPSVLDVVAAGLADAGVATALQPLSRPVEGAWDIIISEGSVAARPDAWLAALKPGGRAVLVERSGPAGRAVLYVRGKGGLSRRELFEAAPPLLPELTPAPTFVL